MAIERSVKPPTGIKGFDLTRVLASPFTYHPLANHGVDVIKLQAVGHDDLSRKRRDFAC